MHCLYCDRPLALLKRLTGDGEFCSKEHRRIYQQEHNQLALARLLEARPRPSGKGGPTQPPDVHQQPTGDSQPAAVKQDAYPTPDAAGFLAESLPESRELEAVGATAGAPRFERWSPFGG